MIRMKHTGRLEVTDTVLEQEEEKVIFFIYEFLGGKDLQ